MRSYGGGGHSMSAMGLRPGLISVTSRTAGKTIGFDRHDCSQALVLSQVWCSIWCRLHFEFGLKSMTQQGCQKSSSIMGGVNNIPRLSDPEETFPKGENPVNTHTGRGGGTPSGPFVTRKKKKKNSSGKIMGQKYWIRTIRGKAAEIFQSWFLILCSKIHNLALN